MIVKEFYDKRTGTLTYIVYDQASNDAVIIDPVLDYNSHSGKYFFESMELILSFIESHGLTIRMILETHAHADHLTSSLFLKEKFPNAKVGIGEKITLVQKTFKEVFNIDDVSVEGSEFDLLLKENNTYQAGTLSFLVLSTPGHTPACSSYLFNEEALFVGDALFMPDSGCGRCDFPLGSAKDLFHSIKDKIFSLNPNIKVFVGHDYCPNGRSVEFVSTVEEQAKHNIKINNETAFESFVKMREERDAELDAPKLLLPSIQVNIKAGAFPKAESNGKVYLKLPLESK
tara:strand:+ start:225759 stop:226619 length:861 start_codon:yes stop_codon:yes gene_type:complete